MWEWRLFGVLNETTQELLDTLAITLGALKVSQALLPERRSDLFIVPPMPNIGIKFRNLTSSTPMLEIKCAKDIEGTCGAQKWLKKRVVVPADIDMENDEAVKLAIIGSGVEELEQVEIKFPLQRVHLQKERQQWRLAMAVNPVQVEITSLSIAINDGPVQKERHFTVCVESKSAEALGEVLVKLNIGEVFESHAIQNIYVVEAIHIKAPNAKAAASPSKTAASDFITMVPPSQGPQDHEPALSPVKRKIASEGSKLRLIEMGYPAFACNVVQAAIAQLGKEIH
ncbi:Aste57867_19445 [Aphanomyces stellatus]|uniref:Aste57867_19445 protein n=1 Tax=Aphanomyces stellatus TaxID=120398 RepID=A0A485LDD6_9STRA|nr:hypothetical protein As57867_019381 [Aphanomyces stellatus]VFT96158.1 Aste57867_19445 [Aphanomyces stellatus]